MLTRKRRVHLNSERLLLRPPQHSDFTPWTTLRRESARFLKPWEPEWSHDHLTRKAFTARVYWAQRSISGGSAMPLFIFERDPETLVGAITLDNIRRGPAQDGVIGYWIGERYARQGFMREAIQTLTHHSFQSLDLSRLQAACLPEDAASRGLLESCGFKYEGVAQSYLQINGRWRNHVLYANLRGDRRGRIEAGAA